MNELTHCTQCGIATATPCLNSDDAAHCVNAAGCDEGATDADVSPAITKRKRAPKRVPLAISTTVADAISAGREALEELGSEVREAFDNMPESLQGGNRGEMLNTAADTLESLNEPDVPDGIGELGVEFALMPQRRPSRSDRRNDAVQYLSAARDAVQAWLDSGTDETRTSAADEMRDGITQATSAADEAGADEVSTALQAAADAIDEWVGNNEAREAAEQLVSELDDLIGEAEAVEFPGMYA